MSARAPLIALVLLLAACSPGQSSGATGGTFSEPPPIDPESVERGRNLYMLNCAVCHGADLSGAADWKTPLPSGAYPPPPHDATGHTWHHSDQLLIQIVMDPASLDLDMPSLGLTLPEVEAVLDFIKLSWGPQERRFQWERTLADS